MTLEESIYLVRKIGGLAVHDYVELTYKELQEFAKLIAAAEREACVKIADAEAFNWQQNSDGQISVQSIAEAIRARGEA